MRVPKSINAIPIRLAEILEFGAIGNKRELKNIASEIKKNKPFIECLKTSNPAITCERNWREEKKASQKTNLAVTMGNP